MNIIQEKLVSAYATLVMGERMDIKSVPVTKKIGAKEFVIREEVELEIASRTIDIIS